MSNTPTLTDRAPELAARAAALHTELSYNCAQAVACALAESIGADEAVMYRLAEGFGAGMGACTETCGALSGAVMAISWEASAGIGQPGSTKAKTYALIRDLLARFREQNGSAVCGELKGIGRTTGMLRSCAGCIDDALVLACAIIDERRAERA